MMDFVEDLQNEDVEIFSAVPDHFRYLRNSGHVKNFSGD